MPFGEAALALVKRLLAESGLDTASVPEAVNFDPRRGLDRSVIEELFNCRWIRLGNNATIVGMTGGGKTYLAQALGRAAIRQGMSLRYKRAHLLTEDLALARIDGSLRKLRQLYSKCDLLIIDDFALSEIDDQANEDLLDILDSRAGQKSTIVVGQRAIAEWHTFIGAPLIADAMLDRILCRAYNITLRGESMRKRAPNTQEV